MRLFTKTFVFFISVIILQSSLTVFIITNIVRRKDLEDARRALADEAKVVYDNFNSWKRSVWIDLINVLMDEQLGEIELDDAEPFPASSFREYVNERIFLTGVDCLVMKSAVSPRIEVVPRSYNRLTFSDVRGLANRKAHPYIEPQFLGSMFAIVGTERVPAGRGSSMDLFLIKIVDEEFCGQLTAEKNALAAIYLGDELVAGGFGGERLSSLLDYRSMGSSYRELYDVEVGKRRYNVAVQKMDPIAARGNAPLFLVTYVSNLPYQMRLFQIRRAVLLVLVLGATLAAALSFFLSKNISSPIKELLGAMHLVKEGRYDTKMSPTPRNEIGELFEGFNEMARTLSRDKSQMDRFIREILLLKDYNEKVIHSIRAGIAIVNEDLVVEKANATFLDFFAREEKSVVGKKVTRLRIEIFDRETFGAVRALTEGGKDYFSKVKREMSGRVFEIKLYPLTGVRGRAGGPPSGGGGESPPGRRGCVCTVEDVSEKVELDNKIFQAEKLASLTMLSAGVAHEINNPLGSIMTNVQNLIEVERDEEKTSALKWIEQETRRIARITGELLNFSSAGSGADAGCDVRDVIERVVRLIRFSIKKEKDIAIETRYKSDIPPAHIGEDELKQVIINLIRNSIEAIELDGRILVSAAPGGNDSDIRIEVEDNGSGIGPEALPRIFDPFFTTKGDGRGTGLGLSVVYGIVRKYNGRIDVQSREGVGTKVSLLLPSR